ncbi:MAG: encapsulin [Pseudonocardiaceae bacterium]
MSDESRLPWTDEQWAMVQRIVQESARKARVASSFLPLIGPLPDGQASVPKLDMSEYTDNHPQRGEAVQRLEVDDGETLRLTTIACSVYLRTQQVADPDLASAKQMLGRAADLIGRLEDAIVFNGQPEPSEIPRRPDETPWVVPEVYTVRNGQKHPGLLTHERGLVETFPWKNDKTDIVGTIVNAIQALEGNGHYGPFACVLGHKLYRAATTPSPGSLVLPSDRIIPFLDGGPLRRSSVMPGKQGVVVSLAGSPIDVVVASDMHVSYVQLTLEPRYVLRVSERFVLRMKQPDAACHLQPESATGS